MFDINLKRHLESVLNDVIVSHKPLTGGDINEVFFLETNKQKLVIKINAADSYSNMFHAEEQGLAMLSSSNTFKIPNVKILGQYKNRAFLLLEYIESGLKKPDFSEQFGRTLAALHQQTTTNFGLDIDNYIGSLPQYNCKRETASTFYIEQRLLPQLELAEKNGFAFQKKDEFLKNIEDIIPNEPPSLIHGDLWNGNFLVTNTGAPCLIDPAVCYASREMDIAMMHLFGGFSSIIFESYNEAFKLSNGWMDRLALWQLYYLLVHLNIFGSSYYNQVTTIITKFS